MHSKTVIVAAHIDNLGLASRAMSVTTPFTAYANTPIKKMNVTSTNSINLPISITAGSTITPLANQTFANPDCVSMHETSTVISPFHSSGGALIITKKLKNLVIVVFTLVFYLQVLSVDIT